MIKGLRSKTYNTEDINTSSSYSSMMANLILFTGKGGVGKTTISAATAMHHAQEDRRTILISSDPAHSTDDTLGISLGSDQVVKISDNFWAKNINSEAAAARFAETMKSGMEKLFGNSIPGFDPEIFTDMATFPGMDEFFALDEILRLVQSSDYDVVVFDTAPTGHTLKALNAPAAIRTFLLRILRMKAKIDNIKGIFKARDTTVPQLIENLEQICEKVERLTLILRNPEFVSINLVSIPTESGFQECARTISFLERMGIPIEHIIVNNIMPNFGEEEWTAAEQHPSIDLVKRHYDSQQPHLAAFKALCGKENISLVGMSLLPFEPRAERLIDYAKILYRSPSKGGFNWLPKPIFDGDAESDIVRMSIPYIGEAKWANLSADAVEVGYRFNTFNFGDDWDGFYRIPANFLDPSSKYTKRKTGMHSITFSKKED